MGFLRVLCDLKYRVKKTHLAGIIERTIVYLKFNSSASFHNSAVSIQVDTLLVKIYHVLSYV